MATRLRRDAHTDRLPDKALAQPALSAVSDSAHADPDDLSHLRIAFISGNYNCVRDGANRAQNMLVGYLLERGAAVRIYSPTIDTPAFAPTGDLVSVPSSPLPFGRKEYRIARRLPRATRDDIAAFRPSVFHISLPLFHGRSALRLARRMGLPAVAAMHTRFETYPRYYGLQIFERPLIAALSRFYRACDGVVAPCASAARTMEAMGMARHVGIWTRGTDHSVFTPERRDMAWRRALGLADDVPVIAFLGRLVLEKGLGQFADTVERLRAGGRNFRVLVIGDGPARGLFAERLGDLAVFTGYQGGADLGRALASADMLLNPSDTEAFGNVSLEAMACGIPVVAADATGNSDIVIDGQTGALVPTGDIAGYAAALARYLDDPVLRANHAAAAIDRGREFTWDRANAGMVAAYEAALSATLMAR
ncbi:glycosyltransferase family 4 protein [Novosphingobium colocasiae]|uniref:Glycosyl hydrolase n=1 Tax=Novosphingobium colocasiae TaxID=1256513 RepID=A0A918PK96_9SPHN|nr:glycosyltransferase family 1 protein [Novosphingobium colocasiae]GGZ13883.1 glycosyl hydrolase [Novosphingobium colocasiae]